MAHCKTSTVVIAIDLSSNAEECMKYYVERVHKLGNKVIALHVPEFWGDVARLMSPSRLHEVWNETQKHADELGEKFKMFADKAGIKDFEYVKVEGREPWNLILKEAQSRQADMIVMGSRGMGTIRRTLIGSVSDGVIHNSHIPVLVVMSEKHQ